jgi:hypothetical protein
MASIALPAISGRMWLMSDPRLYVARYGLPGRMVLHIATSAGFVLIAVFVPMPTFGRVAVGGFFGVGFVVLTAVCLTMRGKVALAVDPQGITLGGLPFRHSRTTLVVPWQNIAAVVLFKQHAGRTRMPYVGLKGRTPLQDPGAGGQTRQKLSAGLIPHVDADVVAASRPVNDWKLDRERLAVAIRANVPHVPLHVVEQPKY